MIVLMAGLPGTGKSTLARALAARCAGVVLDKDEIRRVLFPPPFIEYSAAQDDFCQSLMLETAAYLLARHTNLGVFIDGRTFSRAYQLENALAAANRTGAPWRVVECVCAEATARRRLESSRSVQPAQNRTYELYKKLQAEFDPIPAPKRVIDTDTPLADCITAAEAYLAS